MMERRGANKRGGHGPAPRAGCDRKERYNSGHLNPKANPGMTARQQGSAGHGLFLLQLALTAALPLITHITFFSRTRCPEHPAAPWYPSSSCTR